ncbi:MAG: fused MFS/spermidine synthase, partial [Rhodospirillaceae bacterium]
MTFARALTTVISALLVLTSCGRADDNILHSEKSLYQNIYVLQENGLRCLTFHPSMSRDRQTCVELDDPKHLVFSYTRMMLGALAIKPDPERILIIGLGGGTLPMALRDILPDTYIDAVEIDPAVVAVAGEYFGYEEDARLQTHTMDGRVFVKTALMEGKQYDLVMLDAFDEE